MITVGVFEAKTHLSSLLDRVAEGEEVVITKHGKPAARLVSAARIDSERVNDAFEKLKLLRKRTTLGALLAVAARCGALVSALVIDSSAALSWCFEDESSSASDLCSNGFATKVRSSPDFGIWRSPTFSRSRRSVAGSRRAMARYGSSWSPNCRLLLTTKQ
jgi:prevent-host-death family protein